MATQTEWRPKAIVFDLLTGLLDSWSIWDASTPSQSASEGRPWRHRYLELTYGTGAYVPYEDLVRQAARDVGLPESAPARLIDKYGSIAPWEETPAVLEQLKRQGYKLGIVTNISRQLGGLAIGKIAQHVALDAAVTAEESGFYKPAPEAYMAILPLLGVEARDVLFVAGSAGDVVGASKVGFRVVWHNKAGLAKKEDIAPEREGKTLNDALRDYL
jgi:2-haloacid dehalogenase